MDCVLEAKNFRTNNEWLRLLSQLGEPVTATVIPRQQRTVYEWAGEGQQPERLLLRKIGQTVLE